MQMTKKKMHKLLFIFNTTCMICFPNDDYSQYITGGRLPQHRGEKATPARPKPRRMTQKYFPIGYRLTGGK